MRKELKQLTTIVLGAQLWFIELAKTNKPEAASGEQSRAHKV